LYDRIDAVLEILLNGLVDFGDWNLADLATYDMFETIYGPLILPEDNYIATDTAKNSLANIYCVRKRVSNLSIVSAHPD
jgi:hypothetical protein